VLLDVGLHGLFSVTSGVDYMAPRSMSMVRSQGVFSGIVMLGSFAVVPCGMGKMFGCLLVMFSSFLRHMNFSLSSARTKTKRSWLIDINRHSLDFAVTREGFGVYLSTTAASRQGWFLRNIRPPGEGQHSFRSHPV
jgi:hypothetical protein